MAAAPNNPDMLPESHPIFIGDEDQQASTWRSANLKAQHPEIESHPKFTLEELEDRTISTLPPNLVYQNSQTLAENDTKEQLSIDNDLTDQDQKAQMSPIQQANMIDELRAQVDKSQRQHRKELDSLKTDFESRQEELVHHFQGLMKR